jgi:phosphonate transport system substrate-binding protein
MSAAIGLPVKPFFATQYSNLIESMRSKVIQLAWFGGKTYIEAAKLADARAFALTISDKGEKGYYAHLITRGDRPWLQQIKAGEEVQYMLDHSKELTFAFNDLDSTSGYLVPSYYLFAKNSIDPLKVFKKVIFTGDHESTAIAVADQTIEIATNNSEALARFKEKFPEKYKDLKIIWTSPLIPSDPIAYDQKLPEELKEKIRNFFYNYKDQNVLKKLNWSGFEAAEDKDWNPIRELKIGKQILDIQNNPAIGEAEKQNILKGLQAQLDELQ